MLNLAVVNLTKFCVDFTSQNCHKYFTKELFNNYLVTNIEF